MANTMRCDPWGGSASTPLTLPVEARAGVVTEIDVLCNVDNNDLAK